MRFLDCLVCCKLKLLIKFFFLNLSVTCWLAVGRLSADCRPTVDRQSADRFFGELFFTITTFCTLKDGKAIDKLKTLLKQHSWLTVYSFNIFGNLETIVNCL